MSKCAAVACVVFLAIGVSIGATAADEVDVQVIGIQVSPSTINLAHQGEVVTVHADIGYTGVVSASLKLNGVEVWYTKSDAQGNLVAKFDVDKVKSIIAVPSAELTLTGAVETAEGVEVLFSGTDTVRVVDNSGKK